jgi:four helix bundle protein
MNMQSKVKNLVVELTFSFSVNILKYVLFLEKSGQTVLATQLLRAATGIGSNVREAQNAESRQDFIHKMKIAAKEADESEYWLLLCQHSGRYPGCETLINDCGVIIKVLSKIIGTTKRSLRNN